MKRSPTSVNKWGKKIPKYGFLFDSQKELDFYERFIMNQVPKELVEVHPTFKLFETSAVGVGSVKIYGIKYTPDYIIYDKNHVMKHVYDVKNSLGVYGIDNGNKLSFRLFAMKYHIPVEAVVVRTHDFKVAAIGVTKPLNVNWSKKKLQEGKKQGPPPIIRNNVFYDWIEATNY